MEKKNKDLRKYDDEYDDPQRSDMCPDRTMSDFYCTICDAHMNSEQMWESHVSGKRHLKNIKKEPGEMPSKVRAIKVDKTPKLMEVIKTYEEPLVGLSFMTELQRADPGLLPSYTCHLCQANCTWSVVIEHILGTKHRLAFLKVVDPKQYDYIESLELKKSSLDQLAEDSAREHERKQGCGTMEVKLEKPKVVPPPPKREDDSSSVKPSRSVSLESHHERRLSPEEIYDRHSRPVSSPKYSQHSRSGSPPKFIIRSPSRSPPRYKRRSGSRSPPRYRRHSGSRSPPRYRRHSASRSPPRYKRPSGSRSPPRYKIHSGSRSPPKYMRYSRSKSPSKYARKPSMSRSPPKYVRRPSRSKSPLKYVRHSPTFQRKKYTSSVEGKWRHDRYSSDGTPPPSHPERSSRLSRFGLASLNLPEKIQLMKRLAVSTIVANETEVKELKDIIHSLGRSMLQYEITKLSDSLQNKIAKHLVKGDINSLEHDLRPSLERVFDAVNSASSHQRRHHSSRSSKKD